MVFGLINSIKKAKIFSKTHRILGIYYGLNANSRSLTQHIEQWADYFSPDELAVAYLAEQLKLMDSRNDKHKNAAMKYMILAQKAYDNGSAEHHKPLDWLHKEAMQKFRISPIDIK